MDFTNSEGHLDSYEKEECLNEENIIKPKESYISFPEEFSSPISKNKFTNSLSLRKKLPQTSILLSDSRSQLEEECNVTSVNDFAPSPQSDTETEVISLMGAGNITVSKRLGYLLSELLCKYPKCKIIQDMYYGGSNVYKYLYDHNFLSMKSINDLAEAPYSVIISCRYSITHKNSPLFPSNKRIKLKACASFQTVDLYSSIIAKKKNNGEVKTFKKDLLKLKMLPSKNNKASNHLKHDQQKEKPNNLRQKNNPKHHF